MIEVLENSPAQQAGLQEGDMIISLNGNPVSTWNQALREMAKPGGTPVEVAWERGGKKFKKEITLEDREKGAAGVLGIEPQFFIDLDPIIGEFMPGSPAEAAGMKANDRVVAIGGKPINDWREMSEQVNKSEGKELVFTVQRGEEKVDLKIAPTYNQTYEKYVIGVSKASNPDLYEKHQYGLGEAFKKGVRENIALYGLTFKVLKDLVTLKASYKELGGPIRIAQISAKAAERGLANFFYLLAFLSIQLGILNLLPIPVLDGGHVVFIAYEGIARKPLSMKKRLIAQQIGMFLLLTLMVVVTVNDIDSVWGFREILEKIKGLFG